MASELPRADPPRISVINDNPQFLELMSAILEEDSGYDVSLHSGDEMPMADLRAARPQLIIVDLVLGATSGWDIVTLARADDALAPCPIIICSADISQLRARAPELEQVGNIHVLEKPFEIDDLTRMVDRLLRGDPTATASAAPTD